MNDKPESTPWLRLALELGPLLLFFAAYALRDIFWATGVFMVAIVVAMAVSWTLTRHISTMSIVSAVIVMIFGGLTLWLQDETFFKVKTTIYYGLLGGTLLVGLMFGQSFLRLVFDSVFDIDAEGWRKLTLRWGLFFIAMALLNEVVWRTLPTDIWVKVKVFGFLPLVFLFGMAQAPLVARHSPPEDAPKDAGKS